MQLNKSVIIGDGSCSGESGVQEDPENVRHQLEEQALVQVLDDGCWQLAALHHSSSLRVRGLHFEPTVGVHLPLVLSLEATLYDVHFDMLEDGSSQIHLQLEFDASYWLLKLLVVDEGSWLTILVVVLRQSKGPSHSSTLVLGKTLRAPHLLS